MSAARVFRKPYGTGTYRVSVQVSFTDKASALRFAKALDRLKVDAAIEGLSFSRRLLSAIERRQKDDSGVDGCKCGKVALESWCGTYATHDGTHTRKRCTLDADRRAEREKGAGE